MKILFITSGSIGDAIISTGILTHLSDIYPEATFTIAGGVAVVGLFEAFPKLDRIIPVQKKPYNRHWWELWLKVRKEYWDIVVDLRGSAIGYVLRSKKRFIFFKGDKTLSKSDQLAALLGLKHLPPTRLWSSAEHRKQAEKLLPAAKEYIIIAPKTNSSAKDWPIERFAELAQRLLRKNVLFVVLASKAQQESITPLINALPPESRIDLSGATDLLTAYAIMERATLFIGNDSGLLHMAAAAGIHCVGIYGPSNDKIYAPSGSHVKIVKSYEFAMGEPEKRDQKYMQLISVDDVEEAALSHVLHT